MAAQVRNTRTGATFSGAGCIQAAHDAAGTLDDDTLALATGDYDEGVTVTKRLAFIPETAAAPNWFHFGPCAQTSVALTVGAGIKMTSTKNTEGAIRLTASAPLTVAGTEFGGTYPIEIAAGVTVSAALEVSAPVLDAGLAALILFKSGASATALNIHGLRGYLTASLLWQGGGTCTLAGVIRQGRLRSPALFAGSANFSIGAGNLLIESMACQTSGTALTAYLMATLAAGTLTLQDSTVIETTEAATSRPYAFDSTGGGAVIMRGWRWLLFNTVGTFAGTGTNAFAATSGCNTYTDAAVSDGLADVSIIAPTDVDFVPAPGSEAMDSNTLGTSTTDVDGRARPLDSVRERGAWEVRYYVAPPPDPTINLMSVTVDGPTQITLTFDRPPAGDVLDPASYTITPDGDYAAITVLSVALGAPAPGDLYPLTVILTFAAQGTGGQTYTIVVAGITGACGEALGTATDGFTAVATRPRLLGVAVEDTTHLVATFDAAMSTVGAAGAWVVDTVPAGAPIVVSAVTQPSPTTARLTLAGALSLDTSYLATAAAAAADLQDNTIDPAHDDAGFALSSLAIARAWWESDRVLVIVFTTPVKQTDPFAADDALNPANYVAALATGEPPAAIDVEAVDASAVRVSFTGPLAVRSRTGTVTVAASVVSALGFAIATPRVVTLQGVLAPPPARPGDAEAGFRDIRETAMDETGDYALGTSVETLRKMAERIMSTALSSWVYASGLGVRQRLKRLMRDSEIDTYVRDVRARLQALPDVVAVQVTATQSPDGVFTAAAQMQTRTLGPVDAYWPGASPGGVQ